MTSLSEIHYAIQEAKNLNMGNTVPVMTIITQAAKMARADVNEVYNVYYADVNKELNNVESTFR